MLKAVLFALTSEGASGLKYFFHKGSCISYLQRFKSLSLVLACPWKTMFTHPLFWHYVCSWISPQKYWMLGEEVAAMPNLSLMCENRRLAEKNCCGLFWRRSQETKLLTLFLRNNKIFPNSQKSVEVTGHTLHKNAIFVAYPTKNNASEKGRVCDWL